MENQKLWTEQYGNLSLWKKRPNMKGTSGKQEGEKKEEDSVQIWGAILSHLGPQHISDTLPNNGGAGFFFNS